MLSNSLTRDMGLKVGPVMLGTFVKHYFDRVKARESADPDKLLRQDEILYDEAFNIIKSFLREASFHTVEELQGFSNTRTPSSPWTHLVRVLVPISSCDQAATYLVRALGGPDKAREIVGGVKWWQVRGIEGVDGQWITAKKDWREAKKRHKTRESQRRAGTAGNTSTQQPIGSPTECSVHTEDGTYEKYMDEMRCILYIHGGGYYFGSVDQERYSIQRHARKINGRVFAVNYRLAPQYPFPCGLQDVLAAYLYLIRPPPEADHCPIDPAHIVIAGDSAGGGMSLALLQVIRDVGLPIPAGGILISPWCDLTHSFPSVHANTDTDIIPPTGLSLHKPSILWPPPPHDISSHVHASLRQKLRQALRIDEYPGKTAEPSSKQPLGDQSGMPINVGENISVPSVSSVDLQKLTLVTKAGDRLEINQQVHFYTQNALLAHPLVSPALSHLGGLPPLLFIASDKEVLRDEIIYTAHRAANPQKFPVQEQTKSLYPLLAGMEERYPRPTSVHLQVYDGTCHVLPVLFSFSTPAKYCFRSMASFVKFVTGMPLTPPISQSGSSIPAMEQVVSGLEIKYVASPEPTEVHGSTLPAQKRSSSMSAPGSGQTSSKGSPNSTPPLSRRQSLRRALARASSILRRQSDSTIREGFVNGGVDPPRKDSTTSSDVGGPRFHRRKSTKSIMPQERYAGDPAVYENIKDNTKFDMISERVSTQGVIRPLESEAELGAFTVPEELIGTISELAIRRYMDNETYFRQRFAHTYKSIEKIRKKNLERAAKKESQHLEAVRGYKRANGSTAEQIDLKTREKVLNSPGWGYAWALDELERPPPSSIVARRDTEEARKLAEVADQAILGDTNALNANSLWSVMMNFLTISPDRPSHWSGESEVLSGVSGETKTPDKRAKERGHRTLSQLFRRHDSEA